MWKKIILIGLSSLSFAAWADLRSDLLAMNDIDLWRKARSGVGKCEIRRAVDLPDLFCDYYVKTHKWGLDGGLPTHQGKPYGTGCLVAPKASMLNSSLPDDIREQKSKNETTCWGAPEFYGLWNGTSTPICTLDHVKNGANMIRIAIKDSVDPCGLDDIAPVQSADSMTDLLKNGNIRFADLSRGGLLSDCWRINAGIPVLGLYPAIKLSPKACLRARNRALSTNGSRAFLPVMDVSEWQALALGKLSAAQIEDIFRNLFFTKNRDILTQLDKLHQVPYEQAQLPAHQQQLKALADKLVEPTEEEKKEALMLAIGPGQ